jgi:hypothetical protein
LFGWQFLGVERCGEEAESQKETAGHGWRMMAKAVEDTRKIEMGLCGERGELDQK